jgi:hypothetical protein
VCRSPPAVLAARAGVPPQYPSLKAGRGLSREAEGGGIRTGSKVTDALSHYLACLLHGIIAVAPSQKWPSDPLHFVSVQPCWNWELGGSSNSRRGSSQVTIRP